MSDVMTPEVFDQAVRKHELVVLFFADRDMSDQVAKAKGIAVGDALCMQVDAAQHAELMQILGLQQHPALLIMRERVVLYAEACEPSFDTLETLLERVQALDMKKVKDDIEAERAREALEMRGVCLSARRRTASN